jgi:hypothetical protein
MIKTGLYRLDQLTDLRKIRGFFGGTRRVSVTLYDKLAGIRDAEKWGECILTLFSDGRGAYKRTYARRFDHFDALAMRQIAQNFGPGRSLAIHDAGVSDGRTACDFFHLIAGRFQNVRYYASDCEPVISVLQLRTVKVVMNRNGQILEIVLPPFVFNTVRPENFRHYPINYLFSQIARKICVPRVLAAHRAGRASVSSVSLFCADAVDLTRRDGRFRLLDHDLLAGPPFPESVNIVRAMNVLNASYFNERELRRIVRRISKSLDDGGLLIVGSNEEAGSPVRGAIYRKVNGGFAELARSGSPHDAHDVIMAHSYAASA